MPYKSWIKDNGWSPAQRKQAELDAGCAGTPTIYDDMSKDKIRAEYEAVKVIDAWTAREMKRQFPWLVRHA